MSVNPWGIVKGSGAALHKVSKKISDLYIITVLLAYMDIDLGALRKNPHWIHTLVPIAYWLLVTDYQYFPVFDYKMYYLGFGILLTVIQFHFLNIYNGKVNMVGGSGNLSVETSRKLSLNLIIFSTIAFIYGFKTFLHMISTTPMTVEILALIVIYLIGIIYIIFMVLYIAISHRSELGKFLELVE